MPAEFVVGENKLDDTFDKRTPREKSSFFSEISKMLPRQSTD